MKRDRAARSGRAGALLMAALLLVASHLSRSFAQERPTDSLSSVFGESAPGTTPNPQSRAVSDKKGKSSADKEQEAQPPSKLMELLHKPRTKPSRYQVLK